MARSLDSKGNLVEGGRYPNSGRACLSSAHERRGLQLFPLDSVSRRAFSVQLEGPLLANQYALARRWQCLQTGTYYVQI